MGLLKYYAPPNRQSNLQYMKTELCTQQSQGVKPKQTHFVTRVLKLDCKMSKGAVAKLNQPHDSLDLN